MRYLLENGLKLTYSMHFSLLTPFVRSQGRRSIADCVTVLRAFNPTIILPDDWRQMSRSYKTVGIVADKLKEIICS